MARLNVSYCLSFVALLLIAVSGCVPKHERTPASVKTQMRSAYSASNKLFEYVWSDQFEAPRAEKRIITLLDELIEDFHGVEEAAPLADFEPGFRIALGVNQELLRDARERFAAGEKEYAQWRLRAITGNCVACHSRWEAPTDFLAGTPAVTDTSLSGQFAQAEFLFATRQFDKASHSLLSLAKSTSQSLSGAPYTLKALQLWLVIQVRVEQTYGRAANTLEDFIRSSEIPEAQASTLKSWTRALREAEETEYAVENAVGAAERLLEPVFGAESIELENRNLVTTLRASQLLHERLPALEQGPEKRKASYLLAMSYFHLPIPLLDTFKDLYLEQVIREFPRTDEAQRAYYAYSKALIDQGTGSSGTHLDPEQSKRLEELRHLAFGSEPASQVGT